MGIGCASPRGCGLTHFPKCDYCVTHCSRCALAAGYLGVTVVAPAIAKQVVAESIVGLAEVNITDPRGSSVHIATLGYFDNIPHSATIHSACPRPHTMRPRPA